MIGVTSLPVTSWTFVQAKCRECGAPGPNVERDVSTAQVRITFICSNRRCRVEQRQTL